MDQVGDCALPEEVVLMLQVLEFWVGGFELKMSLGLQFGY